MVPRHRRRLTHAQSPGQLCRLCQAQYPAGETAYPQVRILCQMDLTSHQLVQAVMDSCDVNDIVLAEKLIDHTPDHSLGLLHAKQTTGKEHQVLTSMVDPVSFPGTDIVELYNHRWEI